MEPALYQATVETDTATAGRVLEALEEASEPLASAVGMFERNPGTFEVFAHYPARPPRDQLLRLLAAAGHGNSPPELRIEEIEDADWVTLSQGKRGPVQAGRFFVHGSHDRSCAPSHRFVVKIDAGLAFGTAHHASTRGCLIALDALLKRDPPRHILDLGTGSGILAIAAAHATKRAVLASDSDPIAVTVAAANARQNCSWPSVRVFRSDGFAHPRLRCTHSDLIFANLLFGLLYDLAPAMRRHVRSGGAVVLSGITDDQSRGIEARYRSHGFVLSSRIQIDGWTTLVLMRR